MMRIITGKARGVRLATLEGDATRPTAERAKEAIFSTLQFELEGANVLDLFAGSGQMGLEALSRGASHAVFVDRSKDAVEIVRKNTIRTRLAPDCEIFCVDFTEFLKKPAARRGFDLVFLDPPYTAGAMAAALRGLTREGVLAHEARIVCESAGDDLFEGDETLAARYHIQKQSRYGIAHVAFLTLAKGENAE